MQSQEMSPKRFIEEVLPLALTATPPTKAPRRQLVLRLLGNAAGEWTLDLGRRRVRRGGVAHPDLYVEMACRDLEAILAGTFDVDAAVDAGRVRVVGDVRLLTVLGELLMIAKLNPSKNNN